MQTSGDGSITLTVATGNLSVNAPVIASGSGQILLTTTSGDLVMDEGGSIQSVAGDVVLHAAGDLLVTQAQSGSGAIHVQAGGAIKDGSRAEKANLSTMGTLYLEAQHGIGDFSQYDINTDVAEVNAINTTDGQLIIANRTNLKVGLQGVQQMSPDGWLVLYAQLGSVDQGGDVQVVNSNRLMRINQMSGLSESALEALRVAWSFSSMSELISSSVSSTSASVTTMTLPQGQGEKATQNVQSVVPSLTVLLPSEAMLAAPMIVANPYYRFEQGIGTSANVKLGYGSILNNNSVLDGLATVPAVSSLSGSANPVASVPTTTETVPARVTPALSDERAVSSGRQAESGLFQGVNDSAILKATPALTEETPSTDSSASPASSEREQNVPPEKSVAPEGEQQPASEPASGEAP